MTEHSMKHKINIRIEIDSELTAPEIIIRTDQKTDLVDRIVSAIGQCAENDINRIRVYDGNAVLLLDQQEILRVYTEPRKLIVCSGRGTFEARGTLQNMEKMLDPEHFVRISRFEIINLEKITGFDVSVSGTIRVQFEDGSFTWAARRYVHTIEEKLEKFYGEGGHNDD